MSNLQKEKVLGELHLRFGDARKIKGSESLYVIGNEAARVYFRYSKCTLVVAPFLVCAKSTCASSKDTIPISAFFWITIRRRCSCHTRILSKYSRVASQQGTDNIKSSCLLEPTP